MQLLPHLTAILITGIDAENFLQAQLSSNVKALTGQDAQLASWCAANGRVIGLGWLYRIEPGFCWIVNESDVDALIAGLSKYKLRSKVVIEADPRKVIMGAGGACVLRLADQRTLSLTEHTVMIDRKALANWLDADITQGIATSGGGERFLPQMLNLERYDGLSLKKGCFPGQEVIARLHYKGEVKRDLRVLHSDSNLAIGSWPIIDSAERVEVLQSQNQHALAVVHKAQPAAFEVLINGQVIAVRCTAPEPVSRSTERGSPNPAV
jgi:tRNA-modifying protein YgfZ